MAEGGGLGQSTVKGSDAFYDYNCADCLRTKDTYTEAIFYCPECHKYICKPCYVCDHDVIGRRNVDKWGQPSKRAKFDPCPNHKGHLLELYCQKHDVVCCHVCSQSEHKSCGKSVYIPLVANAKDNKANLQKVKKGLGELHLKADTTSKDRTTKLNGLDKTEHRLVSGVKDFRARVDALLDNMEKKSLEDIATFKKMLKERCTNELDICDTVKAEVKELQTKLDSTSTDESLLFSRIKQGNEQVRDKGQLLSDITMSSVKDEFEPHIEIENILKNLQGLGELLTDSLVETPDISGSSGRVKQSNRQGMGSQSKRPNKPYRRVKRSRFSVKMKHDKKTCDIWGICMMPSGQLILADGTNNSLKQVNGQYKVTGTCPLTAAPYAICNVEADQVAVALNDQTVQLVTVAGSMSCASSFTANHDCYSIAYSNNNLYITGRPTNAVHVYSLTGTQLRVITKDQHGNPLFSNTRLITASNDGARLYITDNKGLTTMDTGGNLITRFTSGDPYTVCADRDGNLFVGGNGTHEVFYIGGKTGKKLAEILPASDGVDVQSLCFDSVNSRLIVFSRTSDNGHVQHLSR